jgi:hypothetical protein
MVQQDRWRGVAVAACAVGGGLAVAPFVVDAVRETERPSLEAVEAATGVVRDGFQAGDCVVVRPAWFDVPAARLRGAGPGAEAWPYPALHVAEDAETFALRTCERIWSLVSFGVDDGLGAMWEGGWLGEAEEVFGADGVAVRRIAVKEPVAVLASLSGELAEVSVRRGRPDAKGGSCRWAGDRHRCGREGWLDVRRESRNVGHHEVFWTFVHPGPKEEEAALGWKSAAARPAGEAWLVLRWGFSMEAVRRMDGGPVRLKVAIGGSEVGSFEVPPREWRLWSASWPMPAGAEWPEVRVTVQADDPGWRELLVEGSIVDAPPQL